MQTPTTVELDAEYRLLREEAGFVDRSGRGKLLATGPDAAALLQGQLTNDIEALAEGEGCYAALLDRKGHMQADMRVLRFGPEEIWLDTEADTAAAVVRHLTMFGVGRDARVTDVSAAWAILSIIGPRGLELSGASPLDSEHSHQRLAREDAEVVAVATDLGVDLLAPVDAAGALRSSLQDAGAAEVSEAAAEILRVESGRPRYGREMTRRTIPAEAHINERAVSFTKGCYIGQETVARLHYKGRPNRHLRGLRLGSPVQAGDPVWLGDRELGSVGTAVLSPAHGPIALAILRREAAPGARVVVGADIAAEVVDPPF